MEDRSNRIMIWVAVATTVLTGLGYLALILTGNTDQSHPWTSDLLALYIFVMAGLLATSLVRRWSLARLPFRAAATGGLIGLGILALFSIGLPVLVAGVLAAVVTLQALAGRRFGVFARSVLVPALAAIVALLVLFVLANRIFVCPARGELSGGGSGFLTGSYSFRCVDGSLVYYSDREDAKP